MRSILGAGWKSAYDVTVTAQVEYLDGKSAARRTVSVSFETTGISIRGLGVDQRWAYADVRCVSEDPGDLPQIFRCRSSETEASRLIVGDWITIESLRARCPDLADRARRQRQRTRGTVWAAIGIVSLGLVVWSAIHYLPRFVAPLIPVAWEEALGDGVVEDIKGIFGALSKGEARQCETADGRLALDILTGRLVDQIKSPYRFEVIVLDVNMVNALAAPGGRIVVFKKLLTDAKSADEVAGVLAHEMGHVISRHPTEAVARSLGISLVFNVLLGGLGSGATGAAGQALVSSAYSRDAERESDFIALDILRGAGISPKGFAEFFDRLAKEESNALRAMSFISSHPPSADRAQFARQATSANTRPVLSAAQWRDLQNICG